MASSHEICIPTQANLEAAVVALDGEGDLSFEVAHACIKDGFCRFGKFRESGQPEFTGTLTTHYSGKLFIATKGYVVQRWYCVEGASVQWCQSMSQVINSIRKCAEIPELGPYHFANLTPYYRLAVMTGLSNCATLLKYGGFDQNTMVLIEDVKFPCMLHTDDIKVREVSGYLRKRSWMRFLNRRVPIAQTYDPPLKCEGHFPFTAFTAVGFKCTVYGNIKAERVEHDGSVSQYTQRDSLILHNATVQCTVVRDGLLDSSGASPSKTLAGPHLYGYANGDLRVQDLIAGTSILGHKI